jgi:hypothetical protein
MMPLFRPTTTNTKLVGKVLLQPRVAVASCAMTIMGMNGHGRALGLGPSEAVINVCQ